jgi:hypothetical protein
MDDVVIIGQVTIIEVTVSREVIGQAINVAAVETSAEVDPRKKLVIQVIPKTKAGSCY